MDKKLLLCFTALLFLSPQLHAMPGLTTPEPMGMFLNGAFPETSPGTPRSSGLNDWVQQDYYPSLTFVEPIRIVEHPTENRLIIVSKDGLGWSVTHEQNATDKTLFFDVSSIMHGKGGVGEGGVSDIAFHPEYDQPGSPNSDYVYISYRWSPDQSGTISNSPNVNGYNRVSRFSVIGGEVSLASEVVMISQYDRQQWHIGGDMFFGTDGFLYISTGDEGNCCSKLTTTQRLDGGLFSGILRIDVDQDISRSHPIRRQPTNLDESPKVNGNHWPDSSTQNYYIPNDNPFLAEDGSQLEEFYAIGLRHPWTITQDLVTGTIWAADVGSSTMEEINIVRKGDNHQWGYMEGTVAGEIPRPSQIIGNEAPPVFAYPRPDGQAVIGGGVYRGTKFPDLIGKYLFSDFTSGKLWTATQSGTDYIVEQIGNVTTGFPNGINSYLFDSKGDILMAKTSGGQDPNGKIQYLARAADVVPSPEPPATLLATGAFTNLTDLTAAAGCIPYEMNAPFWSDDAIKSRWMCIPNDGTYDTAEEQISFSENGDWALPVGSVTIKHFELVTDELAPEDTTRLETRFMVHGIEGWYGVTYRWNQAGSGADLLSTGDEITYNIQTESGFRQQTWTFPDRSDCMTCHGPVAGFVLGPKTRQLNGSMLYPSTGVTANQIETLNALGLLSPAIPEANIDEFLASTLTATALNDEAASLSARARSYLDTNCAYCHRPSGVRAEFDARLTTPLAQQNIIGGTIIEPLGLDNPAVVAPGDLQNSMIFHRANSAGESFSMPPLSKDIVHTEGMAVLAEWILALDQFVVGNDTSTGGSFIDGHHPSLYINEQDTFVQDNESGELHVEEFSFFAQRLGNPITPLVVRVDADNDFTVLAIGTTRTPSEYAVGENNFSFDEDGVISLGLMAGDRIAIGFMDSNPDGTGWGAGSVIPAELGSGNSQDEIFALLPSPLILQTSGFDPSRDTATVVVGEKIAETNAGKSVNAFTQLRRSYKFSVSFSMTGADDTMEPNPNVPQFINGSFESPVVSKFDTFDPSSQSILGWDILSGTVEVDRSPWPASEGQQSMDLSGNSPGSLEQTIAGFLPGRSYVLEFDYGLHTSPDTPRSAEVLINGQVAATIEAPVAAKVPNYQTASIRFVAPENGVVTVGFNSLGTDSAGVVIDNLRLDIVEETIPQFINPSFELPIVQKFSLLFGGDGAIPGWTITSVDAEIDRTPWPASDGDQSMDLSGSSASSIEQSVSGFIPGETYVLSVDYAAHAGALVSKNAEVLIDGQPVYMLVAGLQNKAPNYLTAEIPFVATQSGTLTFGFSGLDDSSKGVVIDNIRVAKSINPAVISFCESGKPNLLVNGSFELTSNPAYASAFDLIENHPSSRKNHGVRFLDLHPDTDIPGWFTTGGIALQQGGFSVGGAFELGQSGFLGSEARDGDVFVEMDGNHHNQIVAVQSGQLLEWELSHQGRNGVDSITVSIAAGGLETEQALVTSSSGSWNQASGSYQVPFGVSEIQLIITPTTASDGDIDSSNLLDDVKLCLF